MTDTGTQHTGGDRGAAELKDNLNRVIRLSGETSVSGCSSCRGDRSRATSAARARLDSLAAHSLCTWS